MNSFGNGASFGGISSFSNSTFGNTYSAAPAFGATYGTASPVNNYSAAPTSSFAFSGSTPNYGNALASSGFSGASSFGAASGLSGLSGWSSRSGATATYQPSTYTPAVSYPFGGMGAASGNEWGTTFLPQAAAPSIGYGDAFSPAPSAFLAQASSKVIVVGSGRLHSDKLADALEVVKRLQDQSRAEKGCERYDWSTSLDDPTLLVIYECWESEADLQEHLDSEHVKVFKQQVQELFSVDPSVQKTSISAWEDI